jgi:hypothetical protein
MQGTVTRVSDGLGQDIPANRTRSADDEVRGKIPKQSDKIHGNAQRKGDEAQYGCRRGQGSTGRKPMEPPSIMVSSMG